MSPNKPSDRRNAIAWGCITVLANHGARGLNHRALDSLLELPAGTTSYYFRTTASLWQAASEALAQADRADVQAHLKDGVVDIDGLLALWTSEPARSRLIARFEIFLAAARDRELQAQITLHREMFLGLVTQAFAKSGGSDPEGRARDALDLFGGRLLQRAFFTPTVVS